MTGPNTTVYDVAVNYHVDAHHAEENLKHVAEHAEEAGHHVHSLKEEFLELGEAIGAMWLFEKAKDMFIEVNNDLEKTVMSMATITTMFHQDMNWDEAQEQAEGFFDFYREAAKKSGNSTMEFAQMHKDIAPAMEQAGASIKDYKEIVSGAMVASHTMGIDQGTAAMSIQHLIHGTVMNRDRFSQALLGMAHMSIATFNAKAKNDPQFALNLMEQTFNSKQMAVARDHLEHSWEGAVSTLKSQVEHFVEDASGPLFESVKGALNDINAWVDTHPKEIKQFAEDVRHALTEAFDAMKAGVGFLVEHKDLLIHLAEAFVALKTMTILGGAAGSGLTTFRDAVGGLGSATKIAAGGLEAMSANVTTVAGALAALYLGLSWLADKLDEFHKGQVETEGDRNAMYEGLTKSKTRESARDLAITKAKQFGAIKENGELDTDKFYAGMFGQGWSLNNDASQVRDMMRVVKAAWDPAEAARRAGLSHPAGAEHKFDKREDQRTKPDKTQVNVTINKVEVASPDPDRFAFGLDKAFKRVAQNPTSAYDGLRGGI